MSTSKQADLKLIELLATYPEREELHQKFPELEEEDIQQALFCFPT
jgi:uncharacterized protein (DUF433 family)